MVHICTSRQNLPEETQNETDYSTCTNAIEARKPDDDVSNLINASIKTSNGISHNAYWQEFIEFYYSYTNCPVILPIDTQLLSRYVAHIWEKKTEITIIRFKSCTVSFLQNINNAYDP